MHPCSLPIDELLAQCQVKTARGSGPGGQHRNKTDTAVVIRHVSGIIGQASESRSQDTNRKVALHRLRLNLATHLRTVPNGLLSLLWQQRLRNGSVKIAVSHADFPTLLAEALDYFVAAEFQLAIAAQRLSISSAQLVKLIKVYPPALQECNRQRQALNLHPLN